MEVYKKINNNVALARDAKGRELVVFGKGIGFASMPYELTDLSCIQRTFYDVNEKYFALLRDVPFGAVCHRGAWHGDPAQ